MADDRSCPSCGARVPTGADHCELCGTSISSVSDSLAEEAADMEGGEEEDGSSVEEETGSGADPHDSVYCHQCGHENPAAANYCSQCGTELEDLSGAREAEGTRAVAADLPEGTDENASAEAPTEESGDPQAMMGKQLAWMVGVGLMLVLGFFGVTQWSQQYEWGSNEETRPAAPASEGTATQGPGSAAQSGSGTGQPSSPQGASARDPKDLSALVEQLSDTLDGPVADKIDSLRTLETEATGQEKQQLQSELVRLYIGAGTPGRAALVQTALADATGTVEARRRAADLLYQWMRQVERESGRARVADVARHVASEYEGVVQKRPQNLDARTRMGEAYLLTNNPMKGIQAINGVLKDDSTFVPARFQKGLALLQINRLDQAVREFERVKTYADPENPFYRQAERAIEVIHEQTSKGGEGDNGASTSK